MIAHSLSKFHTKFPQLLRNKTCISDLFCVSKKYLYNVKHSYLTPGRKKSGGKKSHLFLWGKKKKKKNLSGQSNSEQQLHTTSQTSKLTILQPLTRISEVFPHSKFGSLWFQAHHCIQEQEHCYLLISLELRVRDIFHFPRLVGQANRFSQRKISSATHGTQIPFLHYALSE